jgi:hypothetical protein
MNHDRFEQRRQNPPGVQRPIETGSRLYAHFKPELRPGLEKIWRGIVSIGRRSKGRD